VVSATKEQCGNEYLQPCSQGTNKIKLQTETNTMWLKVYCYLPSFLIGDSSFSAAAANYMQTSLSELIHDFCN
jgi:hypothetical protein